MCIYLSSKLLITTISFLTTSAITSKWLCVFVCVCMCVCVYQDSAGEPLYKLFRAIKHQIEKGPVDARVKKAKYTLNDTGLLGDDVEYSVLVRWKNTHTHTHKHSHRNSRQKTCTHFSEIALCFVPVSNSHINRHTHTLTVQLPW